MSQGFSSKRVQLTSTRLSGWLYQPSGSLGDPLVSPALFMLGGLLGALPRDSPKGWWAAGFLDSPWGYIDIL